MILHRHFAVCFYVLEGILHNCFYQSFIKNQPIVLTDMNLKLHLNDKLFFSLLQHIKSFRGCLYTFVLCL